MTKPKPPGEPRSKGGRPKVRPVLNDAKAQEVCDRLSGGEALTEICDQPDMPTQQDVYRLMATDPLFGERIARAREAQQHHEADQCVTMADQATAEDWQVVKLRIWARQWRAAKLAPKTYGDKIQTEVSGGLKIEALKKEDTDELRRSFEAGLIASGIKPDVARNIVRAATEGGEGEAGE